MEIGREGSSKMRMKHVMHGGANVSHGSQEVLGEG
jgi:hypothetical protein